MDTNKLRLNLLNRLLYCSTTMNNFHLKKTIPVLRTESIYVIKGGLTRYNKWDSVLKRSFDGNCYTRNKHEIFLCIFNLLIQKR